MSDVDLKPCPFCGAALKPRESSTGWGEETKTYWFHPGFVTDGDCLMSGQGYPVETLVLWNTRTPARGEQA